MSIISISPTLYWFVWVPRLRNSLQSCHKHHTNHTVYFNFIYCVRNRLSVIRFHLIINVIDAVLFNGHQIFLSWFEDSGWLLKQSLCLLPWYINLSFFLQYALSLSNLSRDSDTKQRKRWWQICNCTSSKARPNGYQVLQEMLNFSDFKRFQ